ncbi:MAG: YqzL family protein [Ruminococcaceae bacterium]|nr:YqzL family protein [Oscillospiraceae bacterium]
MLEKLSWELFCKTGTIDDYLLYKECSNLKENCGEYGTNQNDGCGNQTNTGQGQ